MLLENGYSLEIVDERCLNHRHFKAACDFCVNTCPAGAIKQNGREISIDSELCEGCGICLHECPGEVFTTRKWNERFILDAVPDKQIGRVEIFCARHSQPSVIENSTGIQIPACLGAMSKGIWFKLGTRGTVVLRMDECQDCTLVPILSRIKNTVEYANEWLESCGYEPNLICLEKSNDLIVETRLSAVSAGKKRMSRRNFFLSFYKTASEAINRGSLNLKKGSSRRRRPAYIPKWMEQLAVDYPRAFRKSGPEAYWPHIDINAACGACDACVDYCPTGALTSETWADRYEKYFVPGLCLDCRICMESCPREAITRSQAPAAQPFEKQRVFSSPVLRCQRCGGQAISRNKNYLCYWCAEEPPINSVLEDARTKLLGGITGKN